MKINKSTLCKVANNLRKKGYSLSVAFRLAWRLIKGVANIKVSGVSKHQRAIEHLRRYDSKDIKVVLQREANNTYDKNAIAVLVSVNNSASYKIGYVPRKIAALLYEIMDNITNINASLQAIVGGYYKDMMSGIRLNLVI
ncbi:MAG: HIRAN domain-containing protein [Clostridia bacterium]|nr:HIRAN domain-containing protein [Clostridia bacterium]